MSLAANMANISKLLDNFDKPMMACSKCDDYTEDTGATLIKCSCGHVLIYREPVERVCKSCGRKDETYCKCKYELDKEFS